MATSGYSGTPLLRKLGIKAGYRCFVHNPIDHYFDLLFEIPETAEFEHDQPTGEYDFIHSFTNDRGELRNIFRLLKPYLKMNGIFWISWPKGSSKLPKDINENDVRAVGLSAGLVDVKVCAVDKDWSGLKFMYRKEDRK